VDTAVERFVQWITDPLQHETVLACALAPQLNEDIFAAAAPREARGLRAWLCGQPFVTSRGDFKQYHAVVRASMVRQQRAHFPRYLFRGPATGPLASGSGMTVSPCRKHDNAVAFAGAGRLKWCADITSGAAGVGGPDPVVSA
jgi:hypothetical protein